MSDAPPEADERALAARALDGDEEALGRLLGLHQAWAYNLAYRVLGNEADARDAVQDAYLRTVRSLRGEGSPPRSADRFKPWLRRVVTNASVTQVRRRGAHAASVDTVAETLPGPTSGEPGHAVEQVETRGQVLQVLLGLPETQRVALALREYLDASYDEIAEALDLPRTAIGTLLFRARAAFRASYDRVATSTPPADCPDVVPLFASIVDGEARPANWQSLEEHLRTCDACGGELVSQRRARRMYALLPLLALPAGWAPVKAALGGMAAGAAGAGAAETGASAGAVTAGAPASGSSAAGPPTAPPAAEAAGAVSTGASPAAAPAAAWGPGAPAAASAGGVPAGASAAGAPAAAPGAGVAATASAASTPAVAAGGLGSASGVGGLLAGASGAKLTFAALATAAVVGVGVAAGPFAGPEAAPPASPSPVDALAASPSPAPGASPGAGALPGVAASPSGTSVTPQPGAAAVLGAVTVTASASSGASPTPSPTGTATPAGRAPAPGGAPVAPPTGTPAGPAGLTTVPPSSPTPLLPPQTPTTSS